MTNNIVSRSVSAQQLYYSLDEVARILGCSRATVDSLRYGGTLPIVKIGHVIRVPASALDELVEATA